MKSGFLTAAVLIETLRHYLVAAQDELRVWLWSRTTAGGWTGPEMIEGRAETVSLSGLGIALLMDDLYAGIGR